MAQRWFALSIWCMAVFGAFDMLRGLAAPLMQQAWQTDYAALGAAFAAGSAGYLAGTFVTGWLVERTGVRAVTIMGAVVLVIGTLGLVTSTRYGWALSAFLCAGLGGGILEIGVNAVVPATASGAEAQARRFNLLHGGYGAGAFLFPLAAGLVITRPGAWRALYAVLGAATVLIAAWAAALPRLSVATGRGNEGGAATQPADRSDRTIGVKDASQRWWAHPVLWALLTAIFAYVMAEVGLATWVSSYLLRVRGVALNTGSYLLSGFYFWFTMSRLTAPWWVTRLGAGRALAAALAVSVLAVAWLLLPLPGPAVALCLAGLGFAPVFPTITALASDLFRDQAGRVLGLLFSAAGVGSLWTNLFIGGVAQRFGIAASIVVVLVCLLVTGTALAAARPLAASCLQTTASSQPGS